MMNDLVIISGGEAVTTTLAIADGTENDHASVIKLVRAYLSDLEEFGLLDFKSESTGGRPTEYALLNEQQATLLLTYMRNSDVVRAFKKRLVKAFFEMARQLQSDAPKAAHRPRSDTTVRDLLAVNRELSKVPGVRREMCMALTLQTIEDVTGLPVTCLRAALPALPVEHVANLIPKRIGERLGLSARVVNVLLGEIGLQAKDAAGGWRLTATGEEHGEARPFSRNGHSDYQIFWREPVVPLLRQWMQQQQKEDCSPPARG